jgi:hypothetical protein
MKINIDKYCEERPDFTGKDKFGPCDDCCLDFSVCSPEYDDCVVFPWYPDC